MRRRSWPALLAVVLALLAYWTPAWRVPFLNDDYVFLDAVRGRGWGALLGFGRLTFGWWRPWSRELHYAALERGFGACELPFHVASFALAAAVLVAYFTLVRRLAGPRVAALACAGAAALAAWAVPMMWIAGAQELWMLLWTLLCVHAFAFGEIVPAAAALLLALLSKETAVVTPGIALAVAIGGARMPARRALMRVAVLGAVCVAWALVHPTLRARLGGGAGSSTSAESGAGAGNAAAAGKGADDKVAGNGHAAGDGSPHASPAVIVARTVLVPLNLDQPPAPASWPAGALPRTLVSLVLLGWVAWWATAGRGVAAHAARAAPGRGPPSERVANDDHHDAVSAWRPIAMISAAWALCGWLPVLWPGLGWHSYYTLLGALGAWLGIAVLLVRRRAAALAAIVALVALRAAQAATPSLDWGTEFYQGRAAAFVRFMRDDLARVAPRPAPHTRFFFTRVPSNVGFLTEGAPALRVWYRDTTLWGGFLSGYVARAPGATRGVPAGAASGAPAGAPPRGSPAGPPGASPQGDRFFRYDSTAGWIEIVPADTAAASRDPAALRDQRELAAAFARAHAWPAAAREYAALAAIEPRPLEAAGNAAVCFAMAGDSVTAARWFEVAARQPGADDETRRFARFFARHLKVPS